MARKKGKDANKMAEFERQKELVQEMNLMDDNFFQKVVEDK